MNETIQTIHQRASCRAYQETPVPKDLLNAVIDSGLQAPSAMNLQKDTITAITNKELIKDLSKGIALALDKPETYSCFYHAPCIIIVSGPKDYYALVTDGSAMLQNMFLAATSIELGSCWINQLCGIEDRPEIRALLDRCKIPSNHHVCGCVSLGYATKQASPTEKSTQRITIIE